MKWIPPSQNWLVIKHMHYMKQQVKFFGKFYASDVTTMAVR